MFIHNLSGHSYWFYTKYLLRQLKTTKRKATGINTTKWSYRQQIVWEVNNRVKWKIEHSMFSNYATVLNWQPRKMKIEHNIFSLYFFDNREVNKRGKWKMEHSITLCQPLYLFDNRGKWKVQHSRTLCHCIYLTTDNLGGEQPRKMKNGAQH